MSSTNRNAERVIADFYPTPASSIVPILLALDLPGRHWIEPSAGEGAIIKAVNAVRKDVSWTAVDIIPSNCEELLRLNLNEVICEDFLSVNFYTNLDTNKNEKFDVCVMNPPFSLALSHIERCLEIADTIVCLERINFLGSKARSKFWKKHMADVYVLSKRPSFVNGKTDSIEYCWFVWPKDGHDRSEGKIVVL